MEFLPESLLDFVLNVGIGLVLVQVAFRLFILSLVWAGVVRIIYNGPMISESDKIQLGMAVLFVAIKAGRKKVAAAAVDFDGKAAKIRRRLEKDPKGAYRAFQGYLSGDGPAGLFEPEELRKMYAAGGRVEDLLRVGSLPESHAVALLEALVQERRRSDAPGMLLHAEILDACAGSDVRVDAVVRQHVLAGRLEPLVDALAAVPNPGRQSAFAAGLHRQGRHAEALRVLESKAGRDLADEELLSQLLLAVGRHEEAVSLFSSRSKAAWSSSQALVFFQHCIGAGRLAEAREMLTQAKRFKPPKTDPKPYYDYAVLCEKEGAVAEAADLCQELIAQGVVYKDLIDRYGRLKRRLLEGGATLQDAAAPAEPGGETRRDDLNLVGGNYELRARLGEGGMGVVFQAYDRKLSRLVALKRMRPEIRDGARDRQRFLEEARLISQLTHPNVVGIHDIVEEAGEIYLVFDFIDGLPLSAVLDRRGRLSLQECRQVFSQVCAAVECAHERRIQHRDLKPSNIMVDRKGNSWVMDFGLARMAKETVSRQTHAEAGGTPAFMAPEQHLGNPQRASDVYALGVCLYEMLTGELPFRGPDFLAQKERMLYAAPSSLVPGLGAPVDELVAASLQPDPAKRPPTPLALYRSVAELAG